MAVQQNGSTTCTKRSDVLNYRAVSTTTAPSASRPSSLLDDHARASARPRSTSTPASTGSATQSMATRNRNAYRMLPVKSATRPTMRGPMNDEDCCALPNQRNGSLSPRPMHDEYTYLIGDGEQAVPSCLL